MFKLGVITDEVTQDLGEAVSFAQKYGMSCLELRSVWDRSVFEFRKEDVLRMKEVLRDSGLSVVSLASSLFKCHFSDRKSVEENRENFRRTVEWAVMLGAKYIRGFDFFAEPEKPVPLDARAEAVASLLPYLEGTGAEIVLESDPSVHSYCPSLLASLVKEIGDSRVGAVYEPGNCLYVPGCEKPYPEAYEAIRPYMKHIHIKDAVLRDGKTVSASVGEGEAGYEEIFSALIRDGYEGSVMLETHHRVSGEIAAELLRLPSGSAFSDGGRAASEISAGNILKILERIR